VDRFFERGPKRREGLNFVRQAIAEFANGAETHATNDQAVQLK